MMRQQAVQKAIQDALDAAEGPPAVQFLRAAIAGFMFGAGIALAILAADKAASKEPKK